MRPGRVTSHRDLSTETGRTKGAYLLHALTTWRAGRQTPIGEVARAVNEEPLKQVQPELVRAIAAYLAPVSFGRSAIESEPR